MTREKRWLQSCYSQILMIDDVGGEKEISRKAVEMSPLGDAVVVVNPKTFPELQAEAEVKAAAHLVELGALVWICGDGSIIAATKNPRRVFRQHVRVLITSDHELLKNSEGAASSN